MRPLIFHFTELVEDSLQSCFRSKIHNFIIKEFHLLKGQRKIYISAKVWILTTYSIIDPWRKQQCRNMSSISAVEFPIGACWCSWATRNHFQDMKRNINKSVNLFKWWNIAINLEHQTDELHHSQIYELISFLISTLRNFFHHFFNRIEVPMNNQNRIISRCKTRMPPPHLLGK